LELAIFVHKTQHIQLRTFSAWDFNRFPCGLPSVGDARLQCKTRFIKINQIYLLLFLLLYQCCHLLLGLCEQVWVTYGP
jgi:hypothetical protein